MLEKIQILNFRSIANADLDLAPITVFYGPTGAGKSSVLYAICALRNFVMNPNQAIDGFFNYGFQGLGGFEQCIFNHETNHKLVLAATCRQAGNVLSKYGISFGKNGTKLTLETGGADLPSGGLDPISIHADVSLPYAVNQAFTTKTGSGDKGFTINWNGVTSNVVPNAPNQETQSRSVEIATLLNRTSEDIKNVDIVPHRRGFFKAFYTPVPISSIPTSEDEVATLIINDPHMAPKISIDTDEIFGRDFRTHTPVGTATVYMLTTEKKSKIPVYIVNDGFGVNQVIYMLTKIYRPGFDTILIEEPEVHLHPTVIRKLARQFCEIVKEEKKQLIFTTHSEQFLIALLTCVSEGLLSPSMLKCYQAIHEKKTTTFQNQAVNKEGQLDGGLSSFLEGEMEDLRKYLAVSSK